MFVIADVFDKTETETIEAKFSSIFTIQKKEVITFNVKHAMQLDKPRVEKMIGQLSGNQVVTRILRNLLSSGEQSKTFEELGKTKEYICYVLKKK